MQAPQRGAKGQPFGGLSMSTGVPSMGTSFSCVSLVSLGMLRRSPLVYSWLVS